MFNEKDKRRIGRLEDIVLGESFGVYGSISELSLYRRMERVEKLSGMSNDVHELKEQVSKLKGVVRELCDYVYRDQPEEIGPMETTIVRETPKGFGPDISGDAEGLF